MNEYMPVPTSMRTHACGQLRPGHAGERVTVAGWVDAQRDHGGKIFINLRDRWGVVQVAVDPADEPEGLQVARQARLEDVLQVTGTVRRRPQDAVNTEMATGACEIAAGRVVLLAKTDTPPFVVDEEATATEELHLKYRYLDLRRSPLQRNLAIRHRAAQVTRRYYDEQGFLEIETPYLIRSTPEGARDYLVPSRIHHGRFYALPQSPQQYKQLLMMSGFDRYMQIVHCFRDEDLRADRQPEFTQVDVEMSFVDQEDVIALSEGYLVRLLQEVLEVEVPVPFPRFSWEEAISRFGSDRPDLRYGLQISDVSEVVASCGFRVFSSVLDAGGTVRGFVVPGAGPLSRKETDELTAVAQSAGGKGVVPLHCTGEGLEGPTAKFFTETEQKGLIEALGASSGDLLLLVADIVRTALPVLGTLRTEMARRHDLAEKGTWRFAWIHTFPLLEWDEEAGRMAAVHHPFTSAEDPEALHALAAEVPEDGRADRLPESWREAASALRANAYDVVLNGVEIGGGSIRNHRPADQGALFRMLSMSEEEAAARFGFLLDALRYGAPPHGGIAFGFDRTVALLAGVSSIREVIAFPKTTSALSLMDGSPAEVDPAQLRDLGLSLLGTPKERPAGNETGPGSL